MDFWIGDWVIDRISGNAGQYEGSNNGMAKLRQGEKYIMLQEKTLELIPEKDIPAFEMKYSFQPEKQKKNRKSSSLPAFNDTLDLHIEKLAPHLKGKQVELIVKKQLEAAKNHIEMAIKKHRFSILIIHGKGTGALKSEIEHMLDAYKEAYFYKTVNNGGAVEVLFRY